MKLLVIIESHTLFPSAYVRAEQYRDEFSASRSIDVRFEARQPRSTGRPARWSRSRLGRLLGPIHSRLALRALRRRNEQLLQLAASMDAVYLVKVPDAMFHRRLWEMRQPRIIFDVNDALWHPFHRSYGYERFEEMVGWSDACLCENQHILQRVRPLARHAWVVPDCPQIEDFDRAAPPAEKRPRPCIGWVGSPQRAGTLYQVFEALEKLADSGLNFDLRVLGATQENLPPFEKVQFSCVPCYDRDRMAHEIKQMDVGLFPLYDVEDSYVRGNLKAKVYMAGGAVAACQDLGENSLLIQHRVNGILARDPQSWQTELAWLLRNPQARHAIGQAGMSTIRRTCSRAVCFARLSEVLREVGALPLASR